MARKCDRRKEEKRRGGEEREEQGLAVIWNMLRENVKVNLWVSVLL